MVIVLYNLSCQSWRGNEFEWFGIFKRGGFAQMVIHGWTSFSAIFLDIELINYESAPNICLLIALGTHTTPECHIIDNNIFPTRISHVSWVCECVVNVHLSWYIFQWVYRTLTGSGRGSMCKRCSKCKKPLLRILYFKILWGRVVWGHARTP